MLSINGNATQKIAIQEVWAWIQSIQVSYYIPRKQAILLANTEDDVRIVPLTFEVCDDSKPAYSYIDILTME